MFLFDFSQEIQNVLSGFSLAMHILLLFTLVFLCVATYKRPILGAAGIIILLPTYLFRTTIFGIPTTFLELSFLAVFITFLTRGLKRKEIKKTGYQYPLKKPIILLLMASIISLVFAPDLRAALGLWKAYIIEPIIFFILVLNVSKTNKDKKIFLWALGISTLPIALFAIFQAFSGFGIAEKIWQQAQNRRVTSIFTSPNAVGLYLGPIAAMYMSWIILGIRNQESGIRNVLKISIMLLSLLAIWFTKSEGSWFGLLAALLFIGFFQIHKKWTLIIASVCLIAVFIIPQSRNQIIPLVTLQQHSGQNRVSLWKASYEYITDSPKNFFFGAGIFGFGPIHESMRDPLITEPLIYPHNIILNFWMDFGLLGLVAFILIFTNIFKNAYKLPATSYQLAIMASFIAIIAHGMVDVPYFKNDLAMLFWTLAALRYL